MFHTAQYSIPPSQCGPQNARVSVHFSKAVIQSSFCIQRFLIPTMSAQPAVRARVLATRGGTNFEPELTSLWTDKIMLNAERTIVLCGLATAPRVGRYTRRKAGVQYREGGTAATFLEPGYNGRENSQWHVSIQMCAPT